MVEFGLGVGIVFQALHIIRKVSFYVEKRVGCCSLCVSHVGT